MNSNKTLRSVHFGVVELILTGGIVRNEIW